VSRYYFFRALFDSCEVQMNSTVVTKSSTLFPYRGHFQDTLCHIHNFKNSQLLSQLYIEDSKYNDFSSNPGYTKRASYSANSASFELVGKIAESVFESDRLFPPGVATRITLRRSEPNFALNSPSLTKGSR